MSTRPDLRVFASVSEIGEAERAIGGHGDVVVLVGRQLLRAAGPEVVVRLRRSGAARVIVVGTGDPERLRLEAMRVGADGVFQRDGEPQSQLGAVHGESGAVPRWLDEPDSSRRAS